MKRLLPIFQVGLGILALIFLVIVLNMLFQSRVAETAARRTPTDVAANATRRPTREGKPTPKPTKTQKITWKNTTLKQIHFSDPILAFTNSQRIKIYQWLPDNRRLLLEIEQLNPKDPNQPFQIVTLDTQSSEIVEYGQREDSDFPPVWIQETNQVAYLSNRSWLKESPKLILGSVGNQSKIIDEGHASLGIDSVTGGLLYLKRETPNEVIHLYDSSQESLISAPFASPDFSWGQLFVDPKGNWLASLLGHLSTGPLNLVNRSEDNTKVVDFNTMKLRTGQAWPINAAWSPNGKYLALILASGSNNQVNSSDLVLYSPKTQKTKLVDLPMDYLSELEWGPNNRFLFVRGAIKGLDDLQSGFWLVDTKKGTENRVANFPNAIFAGNYPFMTWSSDGQLAWLNVSNGETQIFVTQISPGR